MLYKFIQNFIGTHENKTIGYQFLHILIIFSTFFQSKNILHKIFGEFEL